MAFSAAVGLAATTAAAADLPDPGQYRLDIVVPELPAMVAMGASTDKVTRPETWRDLALSLVNGVAPDGSIQSGVGIEVAPFGLLGKLPPEEESDGYVLTPRSLRLSVATVSRGDGDARRTFVGAGLRWTYAYDPVFDQSLRRCLAAALSPPEEDSPGGGPGVGTERLNPLLDRCRELAAAYHTATSGLELAASIFSAPDLGSAISDLREPTLEAWASGRLVLTSSAPPARLTPTTPPPKRWAVTGLVGVRYQQVFVSDSDAVPAYAPDGVRRSIAGVARVTGVSYGGDIYLEYSYQYALKDALDESGTQEHRLVLGGDVRLAKDAWLGLGFAASDDRIDGVWKALALANVKWGLGTEPYYAAR